MKRIFKILLVSILSLAMALSSMVFAFAANEKEDNDSILKANVISVNQVVTGRVDDLAFSSIDLPQDEDWYKFTLNADGYVSVTVNHEYGSTDQAIYIYTYDGESKTGQTYNWLNKNAETLTTSKCGLKKGTHYVLLSGFNSGCDYSFCVNYVKNDYWEKEPNNNVVQATPIKVNTTYYGAGETDYYKFTIDNYSKVDITLRHEYGKSDDWMYIHTYDGTTQERLFSKKASKDSEITPSGEIYLDAGTYYLQINGGASGYNFIIQCKDSVPTQPAITPSHTQKKEPSSNNSETTTWAPIEEPEHPDGATYIYQSFYYSSYENYVVIDYYFGKDTVVEIPAEIDGLPVVTLGTSAFESSTAQEITVPSTIKNFGDDAFGQSDGKSRKIICEAGSEAEKYAIDNNIPYETKKEIETKPTQAESVDKAEETEHDNSRMIIIILVAIIVALIIAMAVGIAIMIIKKKEMEGK